MSLSFLICTRQLLFFKKISTKTVRSLTRISTNNPFHLWQGQVVLGPFGFSLVLWVFSVLLQRHWSFSRWLLYYCIDCGFLGLPLWGSVLQAGSHWKLVQRQGNNIFCPLQGKDQTLSQSWCLAVVFQLCRIIKCTQNEESINAKITLHLWGCSGELSVLWIFLRNDRRRDITSCLGTFRKQKVDWLKNSSLLWCTSVT